MSVVNIGGDENDVFYRYKMPKLASKIEGKGNGIKTVIPNMVDIAKSLGRPPTYPTKFFGFELGAQTQIDEKHSKYIVNGAHDAQKLFQLLSLFIEKFVLCPSCKNPETDLTLSKDGFITRTCKACGQRSPVDPRHRLTSYILKNPPKTLKNEKKEKKTKDSKKKSRSNSDEDSAANNHVETLLDDDWAEDLSPEAVAKRQQEVQGLDALLEAKMALAEDQDPYEIFARSLESDPSKSDSSILDDIDALDLKKNKALAIIVQCVFDDKIVSQIPSRCSLLQKLALKEKEKFAVIGGIENLIGSKYPDLIAKAPIIMKQLYDNDIINEEVFLEWEEDEKSSKTKKYVDRKTSQKIKQKCQPFLQWLREAEEESDSEEESNGQSDFDIDDI